MSITTGTMNASRKTTFRSFEHEGATILARVAFDEDGPGLFVEGYDANGRFRAADPTRLAMESSEVGFDYLTDVLGRLDAEGAFRVFMGEAEADDL